MRRISSLLVPFLALAAFGLLLALPDAPSAVFARLAAGPAQEGACTVEAGMTAEAATVMSGETLGLTMNVEADCPAGNFGPLHIVLLLQASDVMANDPNTGNNPRQEVRDAAGKLLDTLKLDENPWIQVGIVEYNEQPNRLCALTNDRDELDDCLRSLRATGDTRLDAAISEAGNVLKRGRGAGSASMQEWIVLFGDGSNDYRDPRTPRAQDAALAAPMQGGCEPVKEAADELKTEVPDLIFGVVCLATGCDRSCMRTIANPSQYVFATNDIDRNLLPQLDRTITQLKRGGPIREVVITNTVGSAFAYVPDSASPAADAIEGDTIVWSWPNPSESSFQAMLRVEPRVAGEQPACAESGGVVIDRGGGVTAFTIDCPTIIVTGDLEPPTPTAEPTPLPSDTPPPGETPSATVPPVATATPTPVEDFFFCEFTGTVYELSAEVGNESPGATVTCEHAAPGEEPEACGDDQTTPGVGLYSFSKLIFLGDHVTIRASKDGFLSAKAELDALQCDGVGKMTADLVLLELPDIYLPLVLRNQVLR